MTLTARQVLQNRYRVVSLLAQGGMGAVYRAWDTRLNIPVAIKEMMPQPGLDPYMLSQLREQFRQEAAVLARLAHPHLVRVTDFFEESGNAYLVMNFIQGECLADRIERQGTLPESQVLVWANQLLDALAYCHGQGVLHRDVKPQNVIICPDGRAILVDFGLVKLWDPRDPHTKTAMRGLGTPEYAPPEQYDAASHTDIRSDIYSLGATLYHALAGQAPPTATQRIVNPTALIPLRALNPRVSHRTERALMQALELRPEARFQRVGQMRAALKGGQPVSPRHAVGATSGPRWVWVGLAVGVVVVAVVLLGGVALGVNLMFRDRNSSPAAIATASATPTALSSPEGLSAPTEVPTLVPTPSIPTPAPTSVSTPLPTATLQPTSTPLPTPTDTPTPSCPQVSGPFAGIWQGARDRLGCAANQSHTTWMAEEHFEHGKMFWREDTDLVYVLYDAGEQVIYQSNWQGSDPEYSCPDIAPSESPPTPIRGFGRIWCTHETVRSGLGWATIHEVGYHGTVQDFEGGSIIRTEFGKTYVLYADGWWERP
jgi:serine/threonine protein kinase